MKSGRTLTLALSCLLLCSVGVAEAESGHAEPKCETFEVELICTRDGWYSYADSCTDETIRIPRGRPIYALLVSGFHQNKNLHMFHWYNFAKCLQRQGAYVHYAWWNNLLAPYMEKPLHYVGSVPSEEVIPDRDLQGFIWEDEGYPNKAIPADDHQFQQDAVTLLMRIHEENPDAAIILVGHSMGGAAVARLAAYISYWHPDIAINLLAPIDPVGNRTCLRSDNPLENGYYCGGYGTFKRYYAVRHPSTFWFPPKLYLDTNIKYLYHRWQQESPPPFDWTCPFLIDSLPFCLMPNSDFLLDHPAPRTTSIHGNSTNVQAIVPTSLRSGFDVYPRPSIENSGGYIDGHGEIVGFRGVVPGGEESYGVGLDAQGDWPSRDQEADLTNPKDPIRLRRVKIMKKWERNPNYLEKHGYAPMAPDLCMVSDDMCTILETHVLASAPAADAGSNLTVLADDDCIGRVTLDGSGSTEPERDGLTYTWTWNDGADQTTGPDPTIELPLGTHRITLVVSDGQVNSQPDWVEITVRDVTAPVIELTGSKEVPLECALDTWQDPGAVATDNCDPDVVVTVGGETVDPAVPGTGVITYDASDAAGNAASRVSRTVVVEDTDPPVIESVTADPAALWPPDHIMVPIQLNVIAYDFCDAAPEVALSSITCNEPDDAPGEGDGQTTGDVQDAGIGSEDYSILLRAEKQDGGDGRVYTMTYTVTDASGNSVSSSTAVTVPEHGDQSEPSPVRRTRRAQAPSPAE